MRLTYTQLVVSLHKINMLVSFSAPLNTRPSVRSSERQRIFLQRRWQGGQSEFWRSRRRRCERTVSRETLVHHYVQLLCATVWPSTAQLLIVIACWLSEWMSSKTVLMIQRKCLKFSLLGRSFCFTDSPDRNTDKHIISLSTLAHPNYAFYSHSANAFWEKMAACLCLYVISALIFPVGF